MLLSAVSGESVAAFGPAEGENLISPRRALPGARPPVCPLMRSLGCSLLLWYWLAATGLSAGAAATALAVPPPAPTIAAVRAALQRDDPAAAVAAAAPLATSGDDEAQLVLGLLTDLGAGVRLDHDAARRWLEKAAAKNALARHYLRWRFTAGFGFEQADPAGAAHWRDLAAGSPLIDPPLARWLELRDGLVAPKFSRAFLWMMDHASEGDVIAQANLAAVYLATEWTRPDAEQHVYWLRQAADHHDVPSLEQLAQYHEVGLLVAKDPARALTLRRQAAEAGSATAQFALAEQYRTGDGVEADAAEAAKWYRLAAAQDHVASLIKLGDLLREGAPGLLVDYPESLRLARKAAGRGNVEALADVAGMLRAGQGTAPDRPAAAKLYEEAAGRGYAYAADMLGWMYQHGELGAPDFAAARPWFEKAADQGNTDAARQLGLLYRDGQGVDKDPAQAFTWLERAARDGDAWSQNEIGWMLRQGLGQPRDDEEAVGWFRLAAGNGEPLGDANLAYHYLNGLAVPVDFIEAARHAINATRTLDDAWTTAIFQQVFTHAPTGKQTELRALLQDSLDDPHLLEAKGSLPELCLAVLEAPPFEADSRAAAQKLLGAMKATRRPQARLTLASHAFTGQNIPCDLNLARTLAEEASADHPKESARMLATIDSVATDSAAARTAARAALRKMAEQGDMAAAITVANRLTTGIAEEVNPELAREILSEALTKAGADAAARNRALLSLVPLALPTPDDAGIAAKVAQVVAARRGRSFPPEPVYRTPPSYPPELRVSGLEGQAEIAFVVDTKGVPVAVKSRSSSHPLFAAAAEAAIRRWRFAPAWERGEPVARQMVQPLTFRLAEEIEKPIPTAPHSP